MIALFKRITIGHVLFGLYVVLGLMQIASGNVMIGCLDFQVAALWLLLTKTNRGTK